MENLCKVCGKTMRLVPAGVSKRTGQPYTAFWACPDKCKQPKKDWVKPEVRQNLSNTLTPPLPINKINTDWDKIAEGKVRNSVAMAFIGQGKVFSEDTVSLMNEWVKWIMKGNEEYPFNNPPF